MKILPAGAELLHADGRMDRQTDTTKLIVAFRNFAKAPKGLTHMVIKTAFMVVILVKSGRL